MNLFLLKIIKFVAIGLTLLFFLCEGAIQFPSLMEKTGYAKKWFKVYSIASKSKSNIMSDTLFIGDSVGGQLFPYTDKSNYLPINGAILMPGQYILANNAIQENPNLKCIVLVATPVFIGAKFEHYLTCNNFVKPFYSKKNYKHFTPLLKEKLNQHRFTSFYRLGISKFAPFSEIDFHDNIPRNDFLLSDIAIEYLKMLDQLCQKKDITLKLVSGPISQKYYTNTKDWSALKAQVKKEKLSTIFNGYFESITYLSEDKFHDGAHLKSKFIPENKTRLLAYINNNQIK